MNVRLEFKIVLFSIMTSKLSEKRASRVELQEAFNLFDKDGNGEVK